MNVKTNKLIRDDVNSELSSDNRLKGTKIDVAVSKGEVTLTRDAGYPQKLCCSRCGAPRCGASS